jgi:ABC-type branched-subunit amino acid transport system substrate-binding protein
MMKIATSVLAAALLSATAAWAGDPGVSDTEIKIGDVNIMTGPAAFVGRGVSLGSKIAAGEINAAGAINGRKIKILTEDDGYIPSRSFQALTKLLEEDGIFALNGTSKHQSPRFSSVRAACQELFQSNLRCVIV